MAWIKHYARNSHKRFPQARTGGFLPAGFAVLPHENIQENGDVLSNHYNALQTSVVTTVSLQGIFVKLILPPSPSFENDTITREFIIEHLFVGCKKYFRSLEKAVFFDRF